MLHGSHQIRSGRHPGRAWRRRLTHSWAIMAVILAPLAVLGVSGSLVGIDWMVLGKALALSFFCLIAAYAISLVIGVSVALLIGWSPYTNAFLPFLDVLQNVPSFALIPVFILLMGYTIPMIIVFTATSIVWPILFYVLSAIRAAHEDLNDAATVFGALGLKRLLYYLIPLSIPAILTGSIVGISIGWEAIIGVEIIGHTGGIGTFLNSAHNNLTLMVGIVAILTLVFIINRLVWTPLISSNARHYAE